MRICISTENMVIIFILTVDEIDEEMKKVAEIEWVESFDVYSEPLLGILTEYEEPEQKKRTN